MKTTFRKSQPKEIIYRCYKNFSADKFKDEIKSELIKAEDKDYHSFQNTFLTILKKEICASKWITLYDQSSKKSYYEKVRVRNKIL